MKVGMVRAVAALAVMALIGGSALAAPPKHGAKPGSAKAAGKKTAGQKPAQSKGPVCYLCKMPLTIRQTKANPTAIRLRKNGPVMFCCAKCKMPASLRVKDSDIPPRQRMGASGFGAGHGGAIQ